MQGCLVRGQKMDAHRGPQSDVEVHSTDYFIECVTVGSATVAIFSTAASAAANTTVAFSVVRNARVCVEKEAIEREHDLQTNRALSHTAWEFVAKRRKGERTAKK
ncbi:unnamed protein product [Rodentolepis nana]|uniref:Uncharacterized protein n=1 Tax=Rodentolepis nana TaxID=102285 RepID=A0A0R3TWP8_RODNA|nr:unnamed protein product [Rodentolepis nana]